MSRHTKEKRKKQHQKAEAAIKEDNAVFDVFSLLQNENLDTKPNMAKFLKSYVKCITGFPKVKPTFYPQFELEISKWFVKFFDGHELIFNTTQRRKDMQCIFCFGLDEVEATGKQIDLALSFFRKLAKFGFVQSDAEFLKDDEAEESN